ncbi:hypothetical protein [Nocardioides convexus]|uniref:hypothetical protein n=1 Tax=Nocardioides convexus TaxID=2712224 RepID=UPI002418BAAA|nr:hypothetical protein [Nocardioides convexus]
MKAKVSDESQAALPPRVPQPCRRDHRLPAAVLGADRRDGRQHDRRRGGPPARPRHEGSSLTQAAKNLLAERGFDPVLGARPLRRTVQREIEDVLAEKMLYGEVGPGQIVLVDVDGEGPNAAFTFEGQKVGEPARHAAARDGQRRPGRCLRA